MNPFHADDKENADRIDVGAIARTGMLIGGNLALACALGQHPVIKSMIEFSSIEPALTPAQTLAVGLALIFGSVATQWLMPAKPIRHRRGLRRRT